jgi:hypothetical protein
MLDVFCHSGYRVTAHLECGTVELHFPIALTPSAGQALAVREAARRTLWARRS